MNNKEYKRKHRKKGDDAVQKRLISDERRHAITPENQIKEYKAQIVDMGDKLNTLHNMQKQVISRDSARTHSHMYDDIKSNDTSSMQPDNTDNCTVSFKFGELFANKDQCMLSQQRTLKCKAMNRIKIILNEFDHGNFKKMFSSIFANNNYTNSSLLRDFNHIKYTHQADDDDYEFANIFDYITDGIQTHCGGKK
eukprot:943177_1